jgi:eukaryotic-like serine/threonine-protein kinase
LFELLTGEPPFTGDSPVAVAYQHVREDPRSPSEVNPQVTPALDAIVLKALSKNPINRYQSAAEMRADLVRVRSGQQPLAPIVMSEDERTALVNNPRATAQTRRINGAGATRYAPAPPPPTAYGDYDDEPDRRRGRRIAIGIAAAVVVGLLALTGYLIFGGSPSVRQVAVPNVSGQQPEAARAALQAANLLATITPVTSSVDEKGRVVGTDPPANTEVAERTTVTLQVGNGPDQAAVPPLSGKTVVEAGPLLIERGLVLGPQTEQNTSDSSQVGKIISSNPAAGENVAAGTPVAVVVGKQQATVAVPDVTGQDADDAQKELQNAGFSARTTNVDGGNSGEVVSTDPPAGAQVAPKSTVTMRVSTGDSDSIDMPDVRGRRIDQAQATLAAEGFSNIRVQLESTDRENENGRVLDQSPSAGKNTSTDDQITLVVGQFSGGGSTPTDSSGGGN